MNLTKPVIIILTIACIGLVGYAYASWNQTINYTVANHSFSIDRTDLTLDYGIVENGTVKTETYIIQNTGNVACTITADLTATGASGTWNINPQTINPGNQATFTLTLTITETGSATVTFTP
jgi:predicted small integral membrane protein